MRVAARRRVGYFPRPTPPATVAQLTGWKRLVLRRCANTRWQQWTGVNTRDTSGTQWVNVNSHQTVQGEGAGNAFEAVTTVTNVKGSYFGFNAPGIAP